MVLCAVVGEFLSVTGVGVRFRDGLFIEVVVIGYSFDLWYYVRYLVKIFFSFSEYVKL